MSTDIKPGQVATACGKTLDAFHFACTLPSGHPGYHQDKNGGVFGPGEEHLTTPAPPVPLSMSAVKSGKRLAWTNSGIVVTSLGVENGAVVFQWDNGAQGQLPLSEVANYLQPAPEPEPEWKPGTVGTATVLYRGQSGPVASTRLMRVFRTSGVVAPGETALPWVDDLGNLLSDEQIADFVLDRPLPTRDQVIEALEGHQFFTDRVMALLDGAR